MNTQTKIKLNGYQRLALEQQVFRLASMIDGYNGGCWSFARTFPYWYPKGDSPILLMNPFNYFDCYLSPKAAGAALSLMAASDLSHHHSIWVEYYHALYSFIFDSSTFSDEEKIELRRFLD